MKVKSFLFSRAQLFVILFSINSLAQGEIPVQAWVQRYNGSGNGEDRPAALIVDNHGSVIVTGYSAGGEGSEDYATIKYSSTGVPLWTNRYNGPGNGQDRASALAVDDTGKIFVTGRTTGSGTGYDYTTIAYSSIGVPLWTNSYNGPDNGDDYAGEMVVDEAGNLFVTGSSQTLSPGSSDFVSIAYSSAGVPLWTNRYNGPQNGNDYAYGLAVDDVGNVFVTGASGGISLGSLNYTTLAYSNTGEPLWTNHFNGTGNHEDRAIEIVVGSNSNVFVTGFSAGFGITKDYATIAYSNGGTPLWTNRYNGTGNNTDQPEALAVGHDGKVFVTGHSFSSGAHFEFATVAYSTTGTSLWTNRYNGNANGNASPNALTVDAQGNVIVTGVGGSASADFATIKYSGSGTPIWTNHYNGPENAGDSGSALAVDNQGNIFVTGRSTGSGFGYDYATIKYVMPPQLAMQRVAGGFPHSKLTLSGVPSSSWLIQRTHLVASQWTNLGPVIIDGNGIGIFQDTSAPAEGAFYRAMQP